MTHLVRIIESGDWSLLRRKPACFLGLAHTVQEIEKAVRRQLEAMRGATMPANGSLLMPV